MRAVTQYLREHGYNCAPDSYYSTISVWWAWYQGYVPSVHSYRQYNGQKHIRRRRRTLGLGKTIAEDWANLLLNEAVRIVVNKTTAQKKLDAILEANRFSSRGNQLVELAFALGTGAMVEYLDGDDVKIDYVRADMIYPLRWDNGRVIDCAFASERVNGKDKQVYLNIHRLEQSGYVVENHLFAKNGSSLTEIPLPEGVMDEVHTGSTVPRFQIITPCIANNIDPDSPLGLSIYANALDVLETTDLIYDSYNNEYRLGRKRITVPISMAQVQLTAAGVASPVFDDDDTEFYALPGDTADKIEEHNMEIRAEEHDAGLNTALSLLSWKTGSGGRRYQFEAGQVKTATEVISLNSDLYRNLKKHELLLGEVLVGMVNAVADLTKLGKLETTISFDDSIIEDSNTERDQDRQDVREGLWDPWQYRMKWRGEDEATAKAATESAPKGLSFDA